MSTQSDIQLIQSILDGLDRNPVARFSYTQEAFDQDDVDGVELFNHAAEQNIPKATKTDYNSTILDKGVRTQGASISRMGWNHYIGRLSYNINKTVQKLLTFLGVYKANLAHNANEYDSSAPYKKGDICFDTEEINGVKVYTWYQRISTSPEVISNIPPTVTLHWTRMCESADIQLQQNIDDEVEAREELQEALANKWPNNGTWNPSVPGTRVLGYESQGPNNSGRMVIKRNDENNESRLNVVIDGDFYGGARTFGNPRALAYSYNGDKNKVYKAVTAFNADGNLLALLNAKAPLARLESAEGQIVLNSPYTFCIDSNAKLQAWANNVSGNDYSRVLVKAGTWTLATTKLGGTSSNPLGVIDISNGRTKSVVGEAGSKIVINSTYTNPGYLCGIKGKVTGTWPGIVNPGNDFYFLNVAVEINLSGSGHAYGFSNCANLTNCTGIGNSHGTSAYGFHSCTNLTNCTGTGASSSDYGLSYGFYNCANLTNCTGIGNGTCEEGGGSYGFHSCANLTNCTGSNVSLSASGYGFSNCRTGFGCKRGGGNSSTFNVCYMEQSSGITAWANTVEGGYNLP